MLDVTWWGHSFAAIGLPGATVVTDPIMARRLFHLRRAGPPPPADAARGDLVLVSHLHYDHLHLPTLRRFARRVPVVVPRGAAAAVPALMELAIVEVEPGDRLTVAGVDIEVLTANHPGGRLRGRGVATPPALGFRFGAGGHTCWYPGDTGPKDFSTVDAVDVALVPIGGWGPSLGSSHLDPVQAVAAVAAVGARWSLPVHYGTFWPHPMRTGTPSHDFWVTTPSARFREAADTARLQSNLLVPGFGERVSLG